MAEENHAETIASLTLSAVAAQQVPQIKTLDDGRTFIFQPTGEGRYEFEDITMTNGVAPLPAHDVHQRLTVQTAGSMIAYINRFKNSDTVLFADIGKNRFDCAIDYHEAPTANDPSPEAGAAEAGAVAATPAISVKAGAKLLVHRAVLQLDFSEQWKVWTTANERVMSHLAFSKFIEENAEDIIEPAGTSLLEIVNDLRAVGNRTVNSSVRNGVLEKFEFKNDKGVVSDKAVEIPSTFTLYIPVYFGARQIPIKAFLRRDVDDDGLLKLSIKLNRLETVRQGEFHEISATIEGGINDGDHPYSTPILYGAIG